jgi:hypothetical protein
MRIVGIEGLTADQINFELKTGGKFVLFEYCVSILILTFKRPSSIYFVRPGQGILGKALPSTLCSLLLGWWGIPWGPIWTISSVVRNLRGGRDVTAEVVASLNAPETGASA